MTFPARPNSGFEAGDIAQARTLLAENGWALLPGAGFTDGRSVDHSRVAMIASAFGRPSARDGGTAIWPVQPATTAQEATFSQRSGDALLHTDAAYRRVPEPRFLLCCVRPAVDGGATRLLPAQHVAASLPPELLTSLQAPQWQWNPPAVFGGTPEGHHPVLHRDGTIRWRLDNLRVGGTLREHAQRFARHVESHPLLTQVHLPADAVLICDNRRVLHGRTTFDDPNRRLLRIRVVDW
ncbi:TauD/TfdA family dioxygenase [Salinactinospora qingdaonensis]|uniref:TauD/TfdA family dioxygenase n=1 Tax=Salinactinospora qingdaonensis TaxID=702744 RepID=A0ABP7FEX4_9ACTN